MNNPRRPPLKPQPAAALNANRPKGTKPSPPPPHAPKVCQPKAAMPPQLARRPAAPPVYKPQPPARVLQRKVAPAPQAGQIPPPRRPPAPPPVYKPGPAPKVLQRKAGAGQRGKGLVGGRPSHLPPAPAPSLIQPAQAGPRPGTLKKLPPAASARPAGPPPYPPVPRPWAANHVIQGKMRNARPPSAAARPGVIQPYIPTYVGLDKRTYEWRKGENNFPESNGANRGWIEIGVPGQQTGVNQFETAVHVIRGESRKGLYHTEEYLIEEAKKQFPNLNLKAHPHDTSQTRVTGMYTERHPCSGDYDDKDRKGRHDDNCHTYVTNQLHAEVRVYYSVEDAPGPHGGLMIDQKILAKKEKACARVEQMYATLRGEVNGIIGVKNPHLGGQAVALLRQKFLGPLRTECDAVKKEVMALQTSGYMVDSHLESKLLDVEEHLKRWYAENTWTDLGANTGYVDSDDDLSDSEEANQIKLNQGKNEKVRTMIF